MKGLKCLENCAQRGDGWFAMTPPLIISWIFASIMFILMIVVMSFGATWIRAWMSGARVTFMELIALQLRRIPVKTIVETRITLIKSGFNVSVDDLSTHYLAGGNVNMVMQGLLKAKVNNIDLSFDQACALDLQDKYK
jgi:uncharacterized protein YqfA (UPF0365 family)